MTAYKEGEVLLVSKPFCYVLESRERGKRCEYCFKRSNSLLKCSACKLVRYCNKSCQRASWQFHKEECICLRRVAPQIPTEGVRLMYRLLLKLQKLNGMTEEEVVFGQKRSFKTLLSHSEDIKQDAERMEEFDECSRTPAIFSGGSLDLGSRDELLDVFGKIVVNSLGISDDEITSIGKGLYLGASVLNHSCLPNAVPIFSGTTCTVRCTVPFSMTEDGPIQATISYIPVMQPTAERKLELKSCYYFDCCCQRCEDIDQDQLMLATQCPNSQCCGPVIERNGVLSCLKCADPSCNGEVYREQRNLCLQKAAETVKSARKIQNSPGHSAINLLKKCEKCLRDCSTFLHKNNIYDIQLREMIFYESINTEQWQEALRYGHEVLQGYRRYYEVNDPVLAVHLLKLGALASMLNQLSDAKDYLLQAQPSLLITHGRNNSLYDELSRLMTGLDYWLKYF